MAKKEEINGINFGEISTIRNILMGQQMDDYENKFVQLQNTLKEQQEIFNKQLSEVEERSKSQIKSLEKQLTERLDHLEKLIEDNTKQLDASIRDTVKAERQELGQLLASVGDKLLNK